MRLRSCILILLATVPAFISAQDKDRHVMRDGSVYTGHLRLRKPSGTGRMEHTNGDVYEGAFEKGQRHGVGICHYANGDLYMGFWESNVQSGEGELRYA